MPGLHRHGLAALVLACGLLFQLFAAASPAQAQARDPNSPYRDSYDVRFGDRLVGSWSGRVSGSSVSQADGEMAGQAVFVRRGYRDSSYFGIVLHDHRHRTGDTFSEIHIGTIPCGPSGRRIDAVHGLEAREARARFATVSFDNRLAATGRPDMRVFPVYGAEAANPATIVTQWTQDSFTLHLSGRFVSVVTPVAGQTFDYERQREGRLEELHLEATFTLERTPATEDLFDLTLCEEKEFLQVVETVPESGRENVVLEGADFYIEFDAPIETTTLDETTVFMTTRNAGGGPIFVATDLALVAPDRVRVRPVEPLLSGTVYDIEVMSGEEGLRGLEEEMLAGDYRMSISTLVEPDELRLEIHQVSRDAPLIKDKPAAGRIFVEWEERDDIDPAWQVLNYPVVAEITDLDDNTVFPEIAERARRPDLISDEERRLGKHALNLFDWTPTSGSLPMHFTAKVKPANPYPETADPEPAKVDHTMQYAAEHSDLLVFDYYLAEHAEWSQGADDRTRHYALLAAQQQQTYMNQVFPIARVVGRFQGSYNIARTICELPRIFDRELCDENAGDMMALFRLFHEHVSARSVAHVIVSYHPPSLGGAGKTYAPFDQPSTLIARPGETAKAHLPAPDLAALRLANRENRNMIVMSSGPLPDGVVPGIVTAPLIEHEFGHVFALPHTPYVEGREHRAEVCDAYRDRKAPGIDGMRIALDGTTGWQKSSEYGNAQSRTPMRNLMFPCAYDHRREYWIDGDQYDWLVKRVPAILRNAGAHTGSLSALGGNPLAQGRGSADGIATSVTFDGADGDRRFILVSGLSDGTKAQFLPTVGVPGPRDPLSGDGPFELRVEDAAGSVLARAKVGPPTSDEPVWPFAVTLALSGEPARIALVNGAEVIGELRASGQLDSPSVTSHAPGSSYRAGEALEWTAGAGPAEATTYSVRYSPDGREWSTLAHFLSDTRYTPDPLTLSPGPRAAFAIVAHDGVAERTTMLPVQLSVPLEPLASWPSGETGAGAFDSPAGAAFNVALDPASLDAVRLEMDGTAVAAKVSLSPSGTIVSVRPRNPVAGRAYAAVVGTGLRAKDGRHLAEELRLEFVLDAVAGQEEPSPWMPDRPALGAGSTAGDRPETQPSRRAEPAREITVTAQGEITLEVGTNPTVPATITRCDFDRGGGLAGLGVVFETNPGSRLEIDMRRAGGTISATLSRSDGYDVSNRGGPADGWAMDLGADGQLTARGKVGVGGDTAGFRLAGECPAQP
ncbi:Ig-like domain-containing protein [Pelagerythrobacter marinus]|uniref:Ig-like domain-containing protein n=1 Tax=Pelagerythrobacter marinus TaxID=538382 RepID=UPI0020369B54|nr:Ig-like domain-containing protein [Pelagerythrobacter marinus]USA38407.1 Ig-like domain-containing protein [Pelagerythrobacter marinus]WPZ07569.1 Ig-like domain-containing protein [Pelagerythrobacter marinus]